MYVYKQLCLLSAPYFLVSGLGIRTTCTFPEASPSSFASFGLALIEITLERGIPKHSQGQCTIAILQSLWRQGFLAHRGFI